nr:PREDICTED: probable arginine--tRNA ligase, mitochondrial [Bemisia tabaci]
MGMRIKNHIVMKVLDYIKEAGCKDVSHKHIYENLRVFPCNESDIKVTLQVSPLSCKFVKPYELRNIKKDSIIQDIFREPKGSNVSFLVEKSQFISSCLQEIQTLSFPTIPKERIVIDFSSPNIAKPFHIGHFRSTIIGNFIANLCTFLGNDVTRLNYLGDWGTQFGLLRIGLKFLEISEEQLKENPVQKLYDAYVKGNALADNSLALYQKAKEEFTSLERGSNPEIMASWAMFKQYTIDDLAKTYKRLNVNFDQYSWESDYAAFKIQHVLSRLIPLASERDNGLQVVVLDNGKEAPILKSDDSTLYLTRDIAAAIDRYEKYNFSAMLYVVDRNQAEHFGSLFKILEKLDYPWAKNLVHVQFGRVRKMSTRKGEVVFLTDILDQAKELMIQRQKQTSTTKDLSFSNSDDLGISALIVHDLKHKRNADFDFKWSEVLKVEGDGGLKLQYTHCRLVSLREKVDLSLPSQCDPSVLTEPEAVALVAQIAAFDDAIIRAYYSLEANVLVHYLFQLSNCTNRCLKVLRVKDEPPDIACQRLLLFHTAELVLKQGMKLLGLKPLDCM